MEFPEESFTNFMRNNKYDYYIIWKVDTLAVTLFVPNTTDGEELYCTLMYMRTDLTGPETKYLQCNSTGGTTALRKDTASQAHCIISGEYYQLNLGGMIHEKIHNVFA